jgi:hypothetical protein
MGKWKETARNRRWESLVFGEALARKRAVAPWKEEEEESVSKLI